MPELFRLRCPYCGEQTEVLVDDSAGDQQYYEDCSVCCRPMYCTLNCADGACRLEVRRDDD